VPFERGRYPQMYNFLGKIRRIHGSTNARKVTLLRLFTLFFM
jgi:hypothetical protein